MAQSARRIAPKVLLPGELGVEGGKEVVAPKVAVTVGGMDLTMSMTTKKEVMEKLRRRYRNAGRAHKSKLIQEAVGLFGYHPKAAIRALKAQSSARAPGLRAGRPRKYGDPELLPPLRSIWRATQYPCSVRLQAMLAGWLSFYEAFERSLPAGVKEALLAASPRTLDRLLAPWRAENRRRALTRPGSLLRQQIPIRGAAWEEGKAGWLEVDTVALCGGSVAGDFVWMVDAVDYQTTWVSVRAMWNRGQAGTLEALADIEENLPFPLLGLDCDNGGEFLNHHVLAWLQKRPRPVFLTRSRPYKKDDNAHVEQKNWTHVRQWFGYERYGHPDLVQALNELTRGPYEQLLNGCVASMKLEEKEREGLKIKRRHDVRTPLERVLASPEVPDQTKQALRARQAGVNGFALEKQVQESLKKIEALRKKIEK